MTNQVKN